MFRIVAALCAVVAVLAATACGGSSAPTPTHVTAVFVDGLNHADFRQACSVVSPKLGGGTVNCEQSLVSAAAQADFFGFWGGYAVVPHSEKDYGDRATVLVTYKPLGGKPIQVSLEKVKGRWLIVSIG